MYALAKFYDIRRSLMLSAAAFVGYDTRYTYYFNWDEFLHCRNTHVGHN
jgi:hypothetical protein